MSGALLRPRQWFSHRRGNDRARSARVKLAGLSQAAILLECETALVVGQEIAVDLPCVLSKRAIVVWFDGVRCVCEFVVPLRHQDVKRCYVEYTRILLVD